MWTWLASQSAAVVGGIPGGEPAAVAVGEVVGDGFGLTCTGVALHPRWVLTAAHCIDLLSDADDPAVFVGDDRGQMLGNGALPWTAVFVPEEYDGTASHDMALIEVGADLPTWIVATDPPLPAVDDRIAFTGYGATAEDGSGGGTRRTATLGILAVDAFTLQAFDPGANLCHGDSGAPGIVDGELVAIGTEIVSSCLGGQTIATLLAPHAAWIATYVPDAPPPPDDTGDPADGDSDDGCSCATPPPPSPLAAALLLALLRRQRTTSLRRKPAVHGRGTPGTGQRPR